MTIDRQTLFSGTEAPPPALALDMPRLAAYLKGKVDGLGESFTVEKFKGGQSNPTYKLTGMASGQSFVLRRRPPQILISAAHDIAREFTVMSAQYTAGFPVPRCYWYCADESVIGSAFYIVSYHAGRIFWNVELQGVAAADRARIYDDMNARLVELHAQDYRALPLNNLGRPTGYTARNLARWSRAYVQSQRVEIPDMDWLVANLPARVPSEEPVSFIHGDFGLHNLIIHPEQPKIVAVLDWEMSTIGNPLIDLTHNCRAWWEPTDLGGAASSLRGQDLESLGIPSMDSYIDLYCRRAGISELPYRDFYFSFVQFRFAAIIQGILKRADSGNNASGLLLQRQERVFEFAAMARATLEGHAT